jgi:hypothetical protein
MDKSKIIEKIKNKIFVNGKRNEVSIKELTNYTSPRPS